VFSLGSKKVIFSTKTYKHAPLCAHIGAYFLQIIKKIGTKKTLSSPKNGLNHQNNMYFVGLMVRFFLVYLLQIYKKINIFVSVYRYFFLIVVR